MYKDSHPYKILIVEDNPGDFLLITDYLEELISSPVIHQAIDFGAAKTILNNSIEYPYDVIFLDLSLPDKGGEDLIYGIMALNSSCPIIVLTGYGDFDFSVRSLSLGVSDYLVKDDLSPSTLYKSLLYNIERKKILSDLEENKKRYSNLFHLSPQAMFVYDVDTMRFLDVNHAAINHYGYSGEEFLNMTIADLYPSGDFGIWVKSIDNSGENKPGRNKENFRHLTKNGKIIQVDIKSNLIQFKGKDARVVLANDITDRLDYIHTIEKQNTKLREISWIQSHVVRAPIARMMSLVNLLEDEDNDSETQKEILTYILDSAHELDGIVKEISDRAEEAKLDAEKK